MSEYRNPLQITHGLTILEEGLLRAEAQGLFRRRRRRVGAGALHDGAAVQGAGRRGRTARRAHHRGRQAALRRRSRGRPLEAVTRLLTV